MTDSRVEGLTLRQLADVYFAESPRTLEEGYRFTATDWVRDFAAWLESKGHAVRSPSQPGLGPNQEERRPRTERVEALLTRWTEQAENYAASKDYKREAVLRRAVGELRAALAGPLPTEPATTCPTCNAPTRWVADAGPFAPGAIPGTVAETGRWLYQGPRRERGSALVTDEDARAVREIVQRQDAMGDPYAWHKGIEWLLRNQCSLSQGAPGGERCEKCDTVHADWLDTPYPHSIENPLPTCREAGFKHKPDFAIQDALHAEFDGHRWVVGYMPIEDNPWGVHGPMDDGRDHVYPIAWLSTRRQAECVACTLNAFAGVVPALSQGAPEPEGK